MAKDLYKFLGIQSVFVEGGAKTLSTFLEQEAFERISIFTAPVFLGPDANGPADSLSIRAIQDKVSFHVLKRSSLERIAL